jgi:ABC-type microcin C transport system permease subunit YejB
MKKRILTEKRGYTIDELRSKAIMTLKMLGVELSEENILFMVDKLIDIIKMTKSGVILNNMGRVRDENIRKITESDINRITKKVINEIEEKKGTPVKDCLRKRFRGEHSQKELLDNLNQKVGFDKFLEQNDEETIKNLLNNLEVKSTNRFSPLLNAAKGCATE